MQVVFTFPSYIELKSSLQSSYKFMLHLKSLLFSINSLWMTVEQPGPYTVTTFCCQNQPSAVGSWIYLRKFFTTNSGDDNVISVTEIKHSFSMSWILVRELFMTDMWALSTSAVCFFVPQWYQSETVRSTVALNNICIHPGTSQLLQFHLCKPAKVQNLSSSVHWH